MTVRPLPAFGVLAVTLLALLSGCAEQSSRVPNQVSPQAGVNAQTEDGAIQLRNLAIAYPGPDGYPAAAAVPLNVRIFNGNQSTAVTLTEVTVPGGGRVVITTSVPSANVAPSAIPSASASPSRSASASAAAATPAGPEDGTGRIAISIAANSYALLVPGSGRYLTVTGLPNALPFGSSLRVTFTFTYPDQRTTSVTVEIPFDNPASPRPRRSGPAAGTPA